MTIFDQTEVNLVAFRRTIYLAIQSRYTHTHTHAHTHTQSNRLEKQTHTVSDSFVSQGFGRYLQLLLYLIDLD